MEDYKDIKNQKFRPEAGFNLSWGSIIAGVVTFVSVFLVLNLISSALGFGFLNLTSPEPLSSLGMATGISILFSLLFSFFIGGFVAGFAARRAGKLHGFISWSLSVLFLFIFVLWTLSSLFRLTGDGAYNDIADKLEEGDGEKVLDEVEEFLRDTGVEELQPEYLENTLRVAGEDIKEAGEEILINPENAESTIDNLIRSLGEKAENIVEEVDRDAIASSLSKNTDLSKEEAEKSVDNIEKGLKKASEGAKEKIEEASQAVEETKVSLKESAYEAKDTADDRTDTFSAGSILIFAGLVLGLAASVFGGYLGHKKSLTKLEVLEEEAEK